MADKSSIGFKEWFKGLPVLSRIGIIAIAVITLGGNGSSIINIAKQQVGLTVADEYMTKQDIIEMRNKDTMQLGYEKRAMERSIEEIRTSQKRTEKATERIEENLKHYFFKQGIYYKQKKTDDEDFIGANGKDK